MHIFCVGLYGGASSETRERLFTNKSTVEVKDDSGQLLSSHPDWDEDTYIEIIESFSEKEDYVYLPRIVTGKEYILTHIFKFYSWLCFYELTVVQTFLIPRLPKPVQKFLIPRLPRPVEFKISDP